VIYEACLRASGDDLELVSAYRHAEVVIGYRCEEALDCFTARETRLHEHEQESRSQDEGTLSDFLLVDERQRAYPRPGGLQRASRSASEPDVDERARQEEVKLVQQLFLGPGSERRRAVLFAGVEKENGCTAICTRTAHTLAAHMARSVCLVDANPRARSLYTYFGVDSEELACAAEPGPLPTSEANGLLAPGRTRAYMRELLTRFDHVFINAPPIDVYAQSQVLSQFVDGVVLIVEAHSTRRERVWKVKSGLETANVALLGIVLNNRTFPIPDAIYRRL
jgi:Mrp family chromosome partitioning ATPase